MSGPSYLEAVSYISEIPLFSKKNDLDNTRELLGRLGRPDRGLRVIHVAGTNGKGSVCAFLESVLRNAGYRTGLFTSPHLVRINERFQVDREEITDDEFAAVFDDVKKASDSMARDGFFRPSYFEFLFAMGMVWFSRRRVDVLMLETGLGGRLDATNVIERPVLTVITSISLDHMEYLGDTIPQIAREKAGILKPGVPVVYDADDPVVRAVIEKRASQLSCPRIPWYGRMTEITERERSRIAFDLADISGAHVHLTVPFGADYQAQNASEAALAAAAVRDYELLPGAKTALTYEKLSGGFARARWEGRMEEWLPDVFLDGAHNEDGVRQVLKTIKRVSESRPVSLLFSAVSDKNWRQMICELCGEVRFSSVTATQIEGKRRVDAAILADEFRKYGLTDVLSVERPAEAFRAAYGRKGGSVLYCTGSLYLVGAIKAAYTGKT